jgi:DNA gyrase inhibitor GyrI
MNSLPVKIVRLSPMQVASFYAFGPEPEHAAANKLLLWAEPRGLADGGQAHRVFGFNNPSPGAGSPNYGYEFWLELHGGETAQEAVAEPQVEVKQFDGGLYAVAHCRGVEAIPDTWRQLVTWLEESRWTVTQGRCLEQHTGTLNASLDELEFDLYQSIAE